MAAKKPPAHQTSIVISGARVHNLKNLSVEIPKNQFVVITGLSGSGKSSLAFDTIYAEGQRRYVESLSAYARQFLDKLDKPDVDRIDGLSPAISIDQKSASYNPRSTVGTVTEIYDYLRLLFASIGHPHCPNCGKEIRSQSSQQILDSVFKKFAGETILILSPIVRGKKGEYKKMLETIKKDGFSRVRVNGEVHRLDAAIPLDKQKKHDIEIVVDRLTVDEDNRSRLFDSLETALKHAEGLVLVSAADDKTHQLYSENLACPDCEISAPELSPRLFSFNSPFGACPTCNGLGDKLDFDAAAIIPDTHLSLKEATKACLNLDGTYYGRDAERTAKRFGFSLSQSYSELTEEQRNILLYGQETPTPFTVTLSELIELQRARNWEGIINNLRRRYYQTQSEGMRYSLRRFMRDVPCPACQGTRLNPFANTVKVANKTVADVCQMSIADLAQFFTDIALPNQDVQIARQILKEIKERSLFLVNVGLTYLSLNRKSNTLSGGEFQRIRLATQIGSGLTGVLYVLDEPSIGLHQRDNHRLIDTLFHLRDLGNTLIVVEHDEDTMMRADYILDIGPGAGRDGGNLIFAGTPKDLLKCKESVTAQYLNGSRKIPVPATRRTPKANQSLRIRGAEENNLKSVDVEFPLGQLICITGVSGSGKSTLINEILQKELSRLIYKSNVRPGKFASLEGVEFIDKVITIDQSPIGRTPRSNPATYTGIFTPIRELFTMTRDAKIRGYKAGRFSFNVKGGRCEACEGDGVVKIEMHFLSDVYVTCETCKGRRFNSETLQVKFKGYSISDVLDMTVAQARDVFDSIPVVATKLQTLLEVGLGYIHLGQNATTLSGGEAQRIKLAKELSKRSTGKTLYLLDEPTTGLHFEDINRLLKVLNQLADTGNTVLVIEHNLDVIKTADYIIDLGPDGGSGGGTIVATGTPEEVAKVKASYTGQFLKEMLK